MNSLKRLYEATTQAAARLTVNSWYWITSTFMIEPNRCASKNRGSSSKTNLFYSFTATCEATIMCGIMTDER